MATIDFEPEAPAKSRIDFTPEKSAAEALKEERPIAFGAPSEFGFSQEPSEAELAGASEFLKKGLVNVSPERGAKILETLYPPLKLAKYTQPTKEFEAGLAGSAAEQLTGMTAPANLQYLIPFYGPAALAVGGAEAVGAGAGKLTEAVRQGDIKSAGESLAEIGGGAATILPVFHGLKTPVKGSEVQNAIPIRESAEVPVGETPGDRGAVEQGIPAPEEAAQARPPEAAVPPESEGVIPGEEEKGKEAEGVLTPEKAAEPSAVPPELTGDAKAALDELDTLLQQRGSFSTEQALDLGDRFKTPEEITALKERVNSALEQLREEVKKPAATIEGLTAKGKTVALISKLNEVIEGAEKPADKSFVQEYFAKKKAAAPAEQAPSAPAKPESKGTLTFQGVQMGAPKYGMINPKTKRMIQYTAEEARKKGFEVPPEEEAKGKAAMEGGLSHEEMVRQIIEEAKPAQEKLKAEYPPLYEKISKATGLNRSELEALGVVHPEDADIGLRLHDLATKVSENAPGGYLNKLYDKLAPENERGRFLWGGTADNPKIGFDPDVPGGRPNPEAARAALAAVNKVRAVLGRDPLPDFFRQDISTAKSLKPATPEAKAAEPPAGPPPVPPEGPPAAPGAPEPGIGPGAAAAAEFSQRNVPIAKTAQAVEAAPPEQRPLGVTDSSTPLFARLSLDLAGVPDASTPAPYSFSTAIKSMAGHSMPKITAALREAGEAGVRYASSKIAAPYKAVFFSSKVLGTGIDLSKFGVAGVEDNLRSIREGYKAEANKLRVAGKLEEAAAMDEKADKVRTLIGGENSPFKTEEEYQDYLEDPKFNEIAKRHVQLWQEHIDPQYKMAQGLDPDIELPSRGLQTGMRLNLKALLEDEAGTKPITAIRGGLTSSFKKGSPFAREAKGTGERYETNYPDLIANTYAKQLEIANQNNFNRVLVENGLAQVDKPGSQIKINGERTMSFPLTRRLLLKDGRAFPIGQNIYLPESLAGEYRRALNVDAAARIPFVDAINAGLNKAALWGLTDATVHVGNLSTALFTRPGSNLLWDGLAKVAGRADVPITLTRAVIKSFADNRQQLAELAEIGALRESFPGTGPLSKTIKWANKTTRLVLDDVYKNLADQGLVERSKTARREFVNQVGQYNKRLQPQFTVWLRDTGFGPFVTAGKTFNALGVRNMILSPGLKASSPAAAAALRMNQLSGWVGAAVLTGTLNYLLTKNNGGGVMGRPGVPVGSVDSGLNDKKGNPLSLPLANILGYGRALRVSGARGLIESKRLGLNPSESLDASLKDIANAAIGPIAGPAVRFGMIAATGHAPAVDVGRASPVAGPHQSQFGLNVQTALREANPVVASVLDVKEGKPLSEAIGRQLPRFTLQQGKSAQQVAQMPKIVDRARLNEYVDDLSRRARKLPLSQRVDFVKQEMEKAQLLPSERELVGQKIQSRIRYP